MNSFILLATVLNTVLVQALGVPHFFTAASLKTLQTRGNAARQLVIWPNPALNQTVIEKRQRDDKKCGRNNGEASCADDECCSAEGWCGKGYFYCSAPACQINYGPACDANVRPRGANTENTPRPHRGSVPYGRGIFGCERSGAVALTFDDGPYNYTEHILDLLRDYNAVATFFVTGHNLGKGAINDGSYPWRSLIQRMLREGHQIGSHTWGHQRLTELTKAQLRKQMIFNEIAIADIIGKFPTYMRPPYSASSDTVDSWLGDMGYHVTYFNLDTEGYLHNEAGEIQQSKSIWDGSIEGKTPSSIRYLQIEHDIVYQAAYNLTEYFLQSLRKNNLKSVTVGQCLNDPPENWYRFPSGGGGGDSDGGDVRDDKTGVPPTMPATKDGRCGPNQGGQTCYYEAGGTCCSRRGWCGKTGDHCGGGCQPVYGTCGWSN